MSFLYKLSEPTIAFANRALAPAGITIRRRRVLPGDTSQNGEIAHLWPLIAGHPRPIVVDVGANDGRLFSNSFPLIERGWQAVLVEPNPGNAEACRRRHAGNPKVQVLETAISDQEGQATLYAEQADRDAPGLFHTLTTDKNAFTDGIDYSAGIAVKTRRLDQVLTELGIPTGFALLSVDTEGHDLNVLQSLGAFRPSIIITERYLWNPAVALAKQALLTELGYCYCARLACNEIYLLLDDSYITEHYQDAVGV